MQKSISAESTEQPELSRQNEADVENDTEARTQLPPISRPLSRLNVGPTETVQSRRRMECMEITGGRDIERHQDRDEDEGERADDQESGAQEAEQEEGIQSSLAPDILVWHGDDGPNPSPRPWWHEWNGARAGPLPLATGPQAIRVEIYRRRRLTKCVDIDPSAGETPPPP